MSENDKSELKLTAKEKTKIAFLIYMMVGHAIEGAIGGLTKGFLDLTNIERGEKVK